jgi:putative tricarboxylic transport membrane protein
MTARPGRDTWIGVVTILLAAGYLTQIGSIHVRAGADAAGVGPRTYPTLVGVALLATGVALVVTSVAAARRATVEPAVTQGDQPVEASPWQHRRFLQGVALAGLTVAYLLVLDPLGFLIATVPYVAGAMVIVDAGEHYRGRRLLIPVVAGVLISIALHALFDGALGVPLPSGLLDPSWGT